MPEQTDTLAFTLEAVLAAMRDWPMNLDVGARADRVYFDAIYVGAVHLDTDHLQAVRSDADWLTTEVAPRLNEAIVARFGRREGEAAGQALIEATQRIADLAAGGLNGGQPAPVAWEALRAEAAELFTRHPDCARAIPHTATLAALAAGPAGRLAGMATNAGVADVFAHPKSLPYLPLLLGLPHRPAATVTAVELPISALPDTDRHPALAAPGRSATSRGRTELSHTRLGDLAPADGSLS